MSNGKDIIIHLIAGLIKTNVEWNSLIQKWLNTFLNHMNLLEEKISVKVDLSNYATKADWKNAAGID